MQSPLKQACESLYRFLFAVKGGRRIVRSASPAGIGAGGEIEVEYAPCSAKDSGSHVFAWGFPLTFRLST
jgi:hypothetical protein